MDSIRHFKRSYGQLQTFFRNWLEPIDLRCREDNQRLAAFYVWARFSMSLRTVETLLDPCFIPNLAVICRGCLEFDASLKAVIRDPELAQDYLEFDKHAKARYLRILKEQGDLSGLLDRRGQFLAQFGADPAEYRWDSWCKKAGGINNLMRKLKLDYERRLYTWYCHFAHGSVTALRMLDEQVSDAPRMLAMLVRSTYWAYLDSTDKFLDFIWRPIASPDGDRCKSSFVEVQASYLAEEGI